LGLNKQVPIIPGRMKTRLFTENTAHSNSQINFQLDWVPIDDAGTVTNNHYIPTTNEQQWDGSNEARFLYSKISSWKGEGIWNRPRGADFEEWVSADNKGMFFAGSGYDGRIRRVLAIGESLNNSNSWQTVAARIQYAG
jgi:hypothetical protein